jgi:hypothetical protein
MVDGQRDLTDPMDRFWTVDQAVAHIGVTRSTVERYVREGLPLHFPMLGGYLDRDEFLAEYRARMERRSNSRKIK